jgi:ribosomal protein L37AE/L43A
MSRCKDCTKAAVRERRRHNDATREYDRKRGGRQSAEYIRAYRAANPEAYKAHTAVGNALRDGRLTREPCLFCGEARTQAHHRDYSKPLDVVWLCSKCHRRLHAYFPETAAHERTMASFKAEAA